MSNLSVEQECAWIDSLEQSSGTHNKIVFCWIWISLFAPVQPWLQSPAFLQYLFDSRICSEWAFVQGENDEFLLKTEEGKNTTPHDAFSSSQGISGSNNVMTLVHWDYNIEIYSLSDYRKLVRRYQGVWSFCLDQSCNLL